MALWEIFADDPNDLSLWVKRPFTTHQGDGGIALHRIRSQRESDEAQQHFASRHSQAIGDYNETADAYHRSNLSTGSAYAKSASVIDSCVARLDRDIRSLTEIIKAMNDEVAPPDGSAGRAQSSPTAALAAIISLVKKAQSTLDDMPSRAAITKETASINHCITAQRDTLASVKDREYNAGYRAAQDEGSYLAPDDRRGSRDSRRKSSGRSRSRDRSERSSGNSGRGSGTRRTSEY